MTSPKSHLILFLSLGKLRPNTCEQSDLSSDTDDGNASEDDAHDNRSEAEEDAANILLSFMN